MYRFHSEIIAGHPKEGPFTNPSPNLANYEKIPDGCYDTIGISHLTKELARISTAHIKLIQLIEYYFLFATRQMVILIQRNSLSMTMKPRRRFGW